MRSLHEITQQWLCRILFVVAGVLPALVVLAWSATIQTPWHKAAFERHLADALNLDVEIAAIEFPRPTTTRIRQLVLSHPQSERVLARFATLEFRESDTGSTILSDGVVVSREALGNLALWLPRIIERRHDIASEQIQIVLDNVQFAGDDSATCQITGDWASGDETVRLNAVIRAASSNVAARVAMAVLFDRSEAPHNIRFVLDSRNTPLACSTVAGVAPGLGQLGVDSTFQGRLWARLPTTDPHGGRQWLVDAVAGEFANVDLAFVAHLIGENAIDGHADVSIRGALFENGRLIKAAGDVDATAGYIDAELVQRLVDRLQFTSQMRREQDGTAIEFSRLAFAFAVDREGLLIQGRANKSLAVVQGEHGTITSQPSCAPVPLAQVLQAVARPGTPLVPIATAVPWLAELLPTDQRTRRK